MKRLIPRAEIELHDLTKIESPYFAGNQIRTYFAAPYALPGLQDLIRDCHLSSQVVVEQKNVETLIKKIERGDWLLVMDTPFLPLSRECRAKYGYLMGRRLYAGPGRWKLINIDYDGVKNTVAILANRLGSWGEEGRLFGSDGKDFENTTRVMTQQWVRLERSEEHLASRSAEYRYGDLRYIKQRFQEGEDNWKVSGKSWHWQPVTADITYEYKDGINE